MNSNYSEETNFTGDTDSALAPLKELPNFKVAKNDLDVRDWDVYGADGRKLGVVADLIVDEVLMKVRYLDVELDSELVPESPSRHLVVPIGSARLQEDGDKVYVNHLDQITLPRFPLYEGGLVMPEYERQIRDAIINPEKESVKSDDSKAPIPADFYQHEHFDESKFTASTNPVNDILGIIERLLKLREGGILTEEEFQVLKSRAIGM